MRRSCLTPGGTALLQFPLRPAGGRGRGPRRAREGEVSVRRNPGSPPPHPNPLPPKGRRGRDAGERRAPPSHRPFLAQGRDLVLTVAEPVENLVGVFAQ